MADAAILNLLPLSILVTWLFSIFWWNFTKCISQLLSSAGWVIIEFSESQNAYRPNISLRLICAEKSLQCRRKLHIALYAYKISGTFGNLFTALQLYITIRWLVKRIVNPHKLLTTKSINPRIQETIDSGTVNTLKSNLEKIGKTRTSSWTQRST